MRPPKPFPKQARKELEALLPQARHVGERRKIISCLLRARHAWPAEKIAQEVGLSVGRVHHIHAAYLREGKSALVGQGAWGGAKRNPLTPEQEREFLKGFEAKALQGEIGLVAALKEAYQRKTQKEVCPATIYNLLKRNGWRKVKARPPLAKADPAAQEGLKKNSPRYIWKPSAR